MGGGTDGVDGNPSKEMEHHHVPRHAATPLHHLNRNKRSQNEEKTVETPLKDEENGQDSEGLPGATKKKDDCSSI